LSGQATTGGDPGVQILRQVYQAMGIRASTGLQLLADSGVRAAKYEPAGILDRDN
jgi:hypothetical protein